MIGKISKGASGRGLMRYLFGPGKANEHRDQRVIASRVWPCGPKRGAPSAPRDCRPRGGPRCGQRSYGTNPTGGHIWHVSLSLPPGDRPLIDEEWAEIATRSCPLWASKAKATARGLGGDRARDERRWQPAHPYCRVVGPIDGSQVDIWQDRKTLSRVCAELENAYGLTVVEGREGKGMPGLSRAELERTAREQLAEPPRITLARLVREASVASKDEAEFVRRLRGSGALVRPRFETGGQEAVVGYSAALRTTGGPRRSGSAAGSWPRT
jgi:hypothetical protein